MPSNQHINSRTARDRDLISSVINVASSPDVPFHQLQQLQCMVLPLYPFDLPFRGSSSSNLGAVVAKWSGHRPGNHKVPGSMPGTWLLLCFPGQEMYPTRTTWTIVITCNAIILSIRKSPDMLMWVTMSD